MQNPPFQTTRLKLYDRKDTVDTVAYFHPNSTHFQLNNGRRLLQLEQSPDVFMEHPHDLFPLNSFLGQGTYAQVYGGVDLESGTPVAVKIINLPEDQHDFDQILREITVLQSFTSPLVAKMFDAYVLKNQMWIVMEYCSVGSLEHVIQQCGPFSEAQTAAAIKMILYGLLSLHQTRYIHRDIKPANILINDKGLFKLADFGLTAVLTSTCGSANSLCGTPYYVAPEVCLQQEYTNKADVWSIGILTHFLLIGQVPLHLRPLTPPQLLQTIPTCSSSDFELPGKPTPTFVWTHSSEKDLAPLNIKAGQYWSDDVKDFLRCCLAPNPAERWDVSQLLQHRFIFDVPRFVQPKSSNDYDVHATKIDHDSIQLGRIPPPTLHTAWPTISTFPAISKNLIRYLKTDDYGFGASLCFLNKLPQLNPPSITPQQAAIVRPNLHNIRYHWPVEQTETNTQILRNQAIANVIISTPSHPGAQNPHATISQTVPSSGASIANGAQVLVALPNISMPENVDPTSQIDNLALSGPKKCRPLQQDSNDVPSKQQRILESKTAHEAYNINPHSTSSGHQMDIQQAKNQ